nr:hypothetical protein Itr_chr05CG20950 [Ipomoea trifida]
MSISSSSKRNRGISGNGSTKSGLKKLWTTEAPVSNEATTTTQDQASDGVPVGLLPPPNLLFISDDQSPSVSLFKRKAGS